jgi:hypothetical protein
MKHGGKKAVRYRDGELIAVDAIIALLATQLARC